MRAREIIKILKAHGWFLVDSDGSHQQFKHPEQPGKATVPIHSGDMALRTLKSISNQTGIDLLKKGKRS